MQLRRVVMAPLAAAAFSLGSCGGSATPPPLALGIPRQCNPLRGDDPQDCVTPWPSSTYEVASTTTASGMQVAVPEGALPTGCAGPVDPSGPEALNREDGFSPAAAMVVHFREGVDKTNLPPWTDLAQSLDPASPTQILDLQGNRQLQFSEIDATATDAARQALFIRPMTRLQPKTTYVVALRRSLLSAAGTALPMPAGFAALVSGTITDDARLEALRPEYASKVFKATDAAGIPRSDLLLAWDFTTASDESLTADVLSMRDQALAAVGDGSTVKYSIDKVEPGLGGDGTLYARLSGTFYPPLFLSDGGAPDGVMLRDASGKPMMTGTYAVPFAVNLPVQAATATAPMPLVIEGHGLLESSDIASARVEYRNDAKTLGMIWVFTNWRGLTMDDEPTMELALGDINRFPQVADKLEQSIVNTIVLTRFARTELGKDPAMQPGGIDLVSTSEVYYFGCSLGGIMGNSFMAYDPDIARGVLNVLGGNWSLLIQRSQDWPPLAVDFFGSYTDAVDRAVLLSYIQSGFDRSDPITTSPRVLNDPLPGVTRKQLLLQMGIGDMQVSNLSTEMVARTMGVPIVSPTSATPYGIPAAAGPLPSGLTLYDFHITPLPNPDNSENPTDNGVHTLVRTQPAAIRQLVDFFTPTGQVVQECTGTGGCVCAAPTNTCN